MIALCIIGAVVLIITVLLNIPAKVFLSFYDKVIFIEASYLWIKPFSKRIDLKAIGKGAEEEADTDDFSDEDEIFFDEEEKPEEPPPQDTVTGDSTVEDTPPDTKPEEKPEETQKAGETQKPGETAEETAEGTQKPEEPQEKPREPKPHLADRFITLLDSLSQKKDAVLAAVDLIKAPTIRFLKKIYGTGLVLDFTAADEDPFRAAVTYGALNTAAYNVIAGIKGITRLDVKSVTIDCLYDTPSEKSVYDGEVWVKLRPASLTNYVAALVFKFLFGLKKYKIITDTFLKKEGKNQ
ncbi:MAG: hypothetical protein IKP75_05345 [Oscillospiraceae bacterium]|nr:hypothetical protein [Oscillospiraceae bacterium]